MSNNLQDKNQERATLKLPEGKNKLLLHSCCAPCSVDLMEGLLKSSINYTIFFYNPNIHPQKEYELRKNENKRFADKHNIEFIDADYDRDRWFMLAKGMENEPERGIRCSMCFDMRFYYTAKYAVQNGFDIYTSSLGISRWKDMNQINASGIKAGNHFNLPYWTYNWRKEGGSARMISLSKQENFYQQQYCGCAYSLRDTNKWRTENDRSKVQIGKDYYSN